MDSSATDVERTNKRLAEIAVRLGASVTGSGSGTNGDETEYLLTQLERLADEAVDRLSVAEGERTAMVEAIRLVSEGVVVCDSERAVTYHNDLARVWLEGRDGNQGASQALHDVLRVAAGGRQNTRTIEILGPPRRSLAISGVPVWDAVERPLGAVAVIEDTTDQRHSDAVRRDFVANVSHELKTPIGALGLLAETLMVEEDRTVMDRLIQRMHIETLRVAQVIDDLLNLSRIESPRESPASPVPAGSVIEQSIGRVRYTAEHRNITIDTGGDLDATLFGRQSELVSAVHHLIENALKYSNEGSKVDIAVDNQGDWTEISVRDYGMGIAPQYLDRIFERFYRVDDARTRATGGTGLGLSIVRHVVQNHGGEIKVTSNEGKGSTFTLRLAARPSPATERLVVEGGTDG